MRMLIDMWISGLRLAIRIRMSGATAGLVSLLRLLFPVVPQSSIPGPAVRGRRSAGRRAMGDIARSGQRGLPGEHHHRGVPPTAPPTARGRLPVTVGMPIASPMPG